MSFELRAISTSGARVVALAEEHGSDFAERAERHDREGSFVSENFEAMRSSGLLAACAPQEFGGFGVESLHDVALAIGRLARGCPSTAIAANMHIVAVWVVVRGWRTACRTGQQDRRARLQPLLPLLGQSKIIISGAGTEPGTVNTVPCTEAVPEPGGYRIRGRKIFATNSEIADSINVLVRVCTPDGATRIAMATVARGTPGMEVRQNWDALGMRGSGSHEIVFRDCFVPEEFVAIEGPLGEQPLFEYLATNFPLVGAFLGIAESARDHIAAFARERRKLPHGTPLCERHAVQTEMGELEVALAAGRAALGRAGQLIDEHLAHPEAHPSPEYVDLLMKEFQCAKLIVNRAAADVVDRALTISGGSGYLSSSPLSRMYRDVRAGPFMQPYSPLEAYEFIGKVSLGIDPCAELRSAVAQMLARERSD
jgi:alkylation response protein AidB-like acyl-CoA dehydrogenase